MPPQTGVHYTVDTVNANAHLFNIRLTIAKPNRNQIVWLPVWTIGSYVIRDFSKHIVALTARLLKHSQLLQVNQLDKNHWQIESDGKQALAVEYQVYAFDLSVRGAYLTNERAFFNSGAILLAVDGQLDLPCELSIKPHGSHTIYTTLNGIDRHHYQAENYHHLIDCPVEIAHANTVAFSINQIQHTVAISGVHTLNKSRLLSVLLNC